MDNYTLEVFPDNKLMVKLLDFNLQEVTTMALDIETLPGCRPVCDSNGRIRTILQRPQVQRPKQQKTTL